MRYTSKDYDWLADLIATGAVNIIHPTPTVVRPNAANLIAAALRIASRVMAEGVIGAALFADWDGEEPDRSAEEAAVRAALLEDAGK